MTLTQTEAKSTEQKLLDKLPAQNVNSLWTAMHAMVTTKPSPKAEVALWKYKELRPLLIEAGEADSAEQAERRVLMLTNPALSTSLPCLSLISVSTGKGPGSSFTRPTPAPCIQSSNN